MPIRKRISTGGPKPEETATQRRSRRSAYEAAEQQMWDTDAVGALNRQRERQAQERITEMVNGVPHDDRRERPYTPSRN